jgi:TonB family protein
VRVDGEIREQPTLRILPPYPDRAAIEDREGVVFPSITIMPDGSVQDVQIVNAKPRGYFESSALNAVRQWRYAPSNTIRKNVIVRMDFELK